jgi:pyruvate carboxylase subunit B
VRYRVIVEGRLFLIEIASDGSVRVDGREREVDLYEAEGRPFHSLLLDGRSFETQQRQLGDGHTEIVVNGRTYRTTLSTGYDHPSPVAGRPADEADSTAGSQAWVTAPLPGLLAETRVAVGDRVQEGDVVVVLESMKMHLELRAPQDGTIASLEALPGQEVDLDQVLAIIA